MRFRLEGPSGGPWSNLLPKAVSALELDQAARGFGQLGLENLQGFRLHRLEIENLSLSTSQKAGLATKYNTNASNYWFRNAQRVKRYIPLARTDIYISVIFNRSK